MNKSQLKLIKAAETLFLNYGFTKATTKLISIDAKVSEATLFRNVIDKKNLFQMVYEQWIEELKEPELIYPTCKEEGYYLLKEMFLVYMKITLKYVHAMMVCEEIEEQELSRQLEVKLKDIYEGIAQFLRYSIEQNILQIKDLKQTVGQIYQDFYDAVRKEKDNWNYNDDQGIEIYIEEYAKSFYEYYVRKKIVNKSNTYNVAFRGKRPVDIRNNNLKLILSLFMNGSVLSIGDLQAKTKLSKTTLIKLVSLLLEENRLIEQGIVDNNEERGRPSTYYKLNKDYCYGIFLYFQNENITTNVLDLEGVIQYSLKRKLDQNCDFEHMIHTAIEMLETCIEQFEDSGYELLGIYVVSPGPLDSSKSRIIYSPRFLNWGNHLPIRKRLEEVFSSRAKIIINNEAVYKCLGEIYYGLAANKNSALVLGVDYRLTSGVIIDGRMILGNQSLAGEIGHIKLELDSKVKCVCGSYGCFRALVLEEHFIQMYLKHGGKVSHKVTLDDVLEAYLKKEVEAIKAVDDLAKWFGLAFSNLILVYDPEIIIIQGSYEKLGLGFIKAIKEHIKKNNPLLFSDNSTEIVFSNLCNLADQYGAAGLMGEDYLNGYEIVK